MAARDACFTSGALPEFPQGPSELDKLAVRLGIGHRDGDADEARTTLDTLEKLRGERPLIWNGKNEKIDIEMPRLLIRGLDLQ
ncbi:hypothetical protein ACC724_38300, partial [Rhizobium ruizarguesonis]